MPLSKAYNAPNRANVEALIEYFNKIGGKKLTLTCIRKSIFKTKWGEKELALKDRCEIQAASLYLEDLLKNNYSGDPAGTIRTVVSDATRIVQRLDSGFKPNILHYSTNLQPSPIHFEQTENLFYKNQLPEKPITRYNIDLLVVFSLRLDLEKRILGFLGIDFIDQEGKPPIGFSKLYPIIKGLENIEYSPSINWDEIQKVNVWLNTFIHRHFRPYPWSIHQAIQVINPLFFIGDYIEGENTYSSIYASTIVRDEDKLHNEIVSKINSSFPNSIIYTAHNRETLNTKPL
jgi:hypothetical protein